LRGSVALISGGVALGFSTDGDLDVGVAVWGFDHGARNTVQLVLDFNELTSHEAFDRENGVLRIGDSLAFCCLTNHAFAGFGERYD